jgi:hypothetical protein
VAPEEGLHQQRTHLQRHGTRIRHLCHGWSPPSTRSPSDRNHHPPSQHARFDWSVRDVHGQLAGSVRDVRGLKCQGCVRSVPNCRLQIDLDERAALHY